MMQPSTPAQIPQGLAGAIALLKQTANPTAPGPMGTTQNSVVGALVGKAEQELGSPAMGDAMPAGGMYGAAEDLRNALPILAQQQQDAQAEQIAQRVRQMNAEDQGIARMAPPMQFDDGGIVGYNGAGSQGQFVAPPLPEEPTGADIQKIYERLTAPISADSVVEPVRQRYEKFIAEEPDYGAMNIAAREKARERRQQEAPARRLREFLADVAKSGLGGRGVMDFDAMLAKADEEDEKAIVNARMAESARRKGDLKTAFDMSKAEQEFRMNADKLRAEAARVAESTAESRYSTRVQAYGKPEQLATSRMQAEAALEQARKDPEMIREMRALGYPLTPAGAASYIRAKAEQQRVSPEALLAREFKIPLTPQGLASLYETRAGARPDRGLTYNEASDNIDKFMNTPAGIQMVQSAQSEAKKQNRPIPSPFEIRQALIEKELERDQQRRAARSAPAAGASTAAPPVGTVMDGYRFKGGDPRNKNNWEKV